MLTIYPKYPGGNPVHKHKKTIEFDVVSRENNPLKNISSYWLLVYPNQLIRLRKEGKLHHLKSQPMFFPKRNGVNGDHLIFQPDFPVFQCI